MSDTAQGPGWWKATDDLWYPPEQHPQWQGEVPPPQPEYRPPGAPDPNEVKKSSGELPSFAAIVPDETRTTPTIVHMGLGTIQIEEDRVLEFLDAGTPEGVPVLFHTGTPFSAAPWLAASEAAERQDFRLITWSRAGYGSSTRVVGRSVADGRLETDAVLRALELPPFISLGWSGGGPYALADAAQLPGRCLGAAVVGSPAPYEAEGLEWLAGMGRARVDEVIMARQGGGILERFLEERYTSLELGSPGSVGAALGGPLSPEDTEVLEGELGQPFVESLRAAVGGGVGGWFDDDHAMMGDWQFDLSSIGVPVTVWQGWDDRQVPPAHGAWLAEHIKGSKIWPLEGEGHVSAMARHLDTIFADLAGMSHRHP